MITIIKTLRVRLKFRVFLERTHHHFQISNFKFNFRPILFLVFFLFPSPLSLHRRCLLCFFFFFFFFFYLLFLLWSWRSMEKVLFFFLPHSALVVSTRLLRLTFHPPLSPAPPHFSSSTFSAFVSSSASLFASTFCNKIQQLQ